MTKLGIMGATGQLGELTLEAALALAPPDRLVACVRQPEKLAKYAARGVEMRRADYDDPATLEKAFSGIERLLLIPSPARPRQRIMQYENAIGAAVQAGVEHLVDYSHVMADVACPFVVTPFLVYAEAAVRTSGLGWTILRNACYADPIVNWVPRIAEMGTIPYPTDDGVCSYVARADAARAAAVALTRPEHDGKVYELTGPEALSTRDLCRLVAEATGRPVTYRPATDEDYIAECVREGMPAPEARRLVTMYEAIRRGFCSRVSDDIARLTGSPPAALATLLQRSTAAAQRTRS